MNAPRSTLVPAAASLPGAELATRFLTLVPGDGASVASYGDLAGNETISATDSRACHIDQLQFSLGEGPCWDALHNNRPVLEPDVRDHPTDRWPLFLPAANDAGVGALFAVPLRFGPFLLGAVDVYAQRSLQVHPVQAEAARVLAGTISRWLLQRVITRHNDRSRHRFHQRATHQAAGVVLAQLALAPADAYLLIEAHATTRGEDIADTANLILTGQLLITPDSALAPFLPCCCADVWPLAALVLLRSGRPCCPVVARAVWPLPDFVTSALR
ncbi:GAF domain-containing protein, partial [Curtobacterium flaccumfaciens]